MPLRLPVQRARPATDLAALRTAADQAFSRTAGAPLVGGNAVRVLRDARENYPAWEAAIESASRSVHVEMYIFHRDRVGRRYVDLLASKARAGVEVRVIYDWFGSGIGPALGLFKPLIAAGGQVLAFNPPSIASALGWIRRNHRKLITVDRRIAFVSGLCIGQAWEGDAARKRQPWRDTGIEIVGPAVAHAEASFADSWMLAGGAPFEPPQHASEIPAAGHVNLRLIPTEPFTANMLRLDLLIGTLARKSLWLTDAYFIGTGPYLEALTRAARDGVDVRLLLPQASDVGWTVPVARALYRPLLEAGVRIFEWNGTMVHAKTAVADSRWARIGSTNLNLNSWVGNWELDVAIEDESIAKTMEAHYEEDLSRSVEIVLSDEARWRGRRRRPEGYRPSRRAAQTVTRVGRSIGAAVTGNRPLEEYEIAPLAAAAVLLIVVAALGLFAPWVLAWPAAAVAAWVAVTFLVDAWYVWRRRRR